MSAGATMGLSFLTFLLILGGAVLLYVLPSLIALLRQHWHTGAILLINLLLGWTLIGWLVALFMACSSAHRPR